MRIDNDNGTMGLFNRKKLKTQLKMEVTTLKCR